MQNFYRSYLLIMFLIFNAVIIEAQQTQFQKVYTFFEYGASATLISEDNDGYLITGYEFNSSHTPAGYFFLKTDLKGKTLWYKTLPRNKVYAGVGINGKEISPVTRVKDKSFYIVEKNISDYGTFLRKTDSTGNLLWERVIDESQFPGSGYIMESRDGSLYIVESGRYWLNIIKTDPEGNVFWNKTFTNSSTDYNGTILKEFSDGSLLITGKNKLIWTDKDGNITNDKVVTLKIFSATLDNDDNIILARTNSLEKLDKNGNQIWSVDTSPYQGELVRLTSDEQFAVIETTADSTYMSKYDKEGTLTWRHSVRINSWSLTETSDGGFMTTANYYYYYVWSPRNTFPVITKTDENGYIKSVSLIFPFKSLNATSQINIIWLKNNVDKIDIDFSSDNGSTWKNIIKSLPADGTNYYWLIALEISDKCMLRISDSDNSAIYDQSDSVFSILPPYHEYEYIAANEIKMWIGNNGDGSHSPLTDAQGLFWPGGENATRGAVFEDGLVFGGKVSGEIRVGGSTYRSGLRPGNVISDTSAADPGDTKFQVWKIKKNTSMLSEGEREKYEYEYNNWPIDIGAPWADVSRDGIYNPGIDHPKFYGEETLFNVMNDFDSTTTKYLYGSNPLGLEIQCLTYGIDTTNGLKDAVFKQYKLINKSSNEITDMYLSYWTDDDMGDANDDYVGVDTTLNMGYTWNGRNGDYIYGSPPPALGHMIIQGPIVPSSESDSARFDYGWRHGYKNLPATAFVFYIGGSSVYSDPNLGDYSGTLQMYNYMHGLVWDGEDYIDPNTGQPTVFLLSGDPVTGTGWYEGSGWPGGPSPGDRRYLISSGPFNLAPGDTQDITIAIFMALGSDYIQSVAALRDKAAYIQEFYNNDLLREINPPITPIENFKLEQNYPNPFNSITNIEYTLPVKSRVTIKIYDILGREVKVFNQGEQVPWEYRVSFNASAFASGVYIYRIEAVPVNGQENPSAGSGQDFIQTKKMVYLK